MDWIKVVAGFALILGAVIAWYRVLRTLRGGGGSGMKMGLPKNRRVRTDEELGELAQIVSAHRKKKAAEAAQAQASGAAAPAAPGGGLVAPLPKPAPAAPPAAPPAPAPNPPAASSPAARVFLSGPRKVVYLLFKAVLPEYLVFPGVSLAEVVEGGSATHILTLIVCRQDLTVAAAVDLVPAGSIAPQAVSQALATAGIRYLAIDPRALPRREAVRLFVHGA